MCLAHYQFSQPKSSPVQESRVGDGSGKWQAASGKGCLVGVGRVVDEKKVEEERGLNVVGGMVKKNEAIENPM